MKRTDKFTFGKYKGHRLKWVMENHCSYVWWCINNIRDFDIEPVRAKNEFIEDYANWVARCEESKSNRESFCEWCADENIVF